MPFPKSALRDLIDRLADFYSLPNWPTGLAGSSLAGNYYPPGEYLEAQILTESSCNPNARHADIPAALDTHGDWEDRASYGLMQVEGTTARGRFGIPRTIPINFSFLYDPIIGLTFGILELKMWLEFNRRTHSDYSPADQIAAALACYNMGGRGGNKVPTTPGKYEFINQAYVDRVLHNLSSVIQDRGSSVFTPPQSLP